MKIVKGQFAEAQIQMICDNQVSENSIIRVMLDVHSGKDSFGLCSKE